MQEVIAIKIRKLIFNFGMAGVILFFTHLILGRILRPEYNPITSYISELTADGAPFAFLLRFFLYTSNVCLLIFTTCMVITSFKQHVVFLRIGYCLLLITAIITIIDFGAFPMTLDRILNIKNMIHFSITSVIMCCIILSLIFIAIGYHKQEKTRMLGRISTIAVIVFLFFNILHLAAILQLWNVLGLVQRLAIYTFYLFILALSWIYRMKEVEV